MRLRVFAGPNGSGKSTVIQSVRHLQINGRMIDFGAYVNADDIAKQLLADHFSFQEFKIGNYSKEELLLTASMTGLPQISLGVDDLGNTLEVLNNQVTLKSKDFAEEIAQILAECIRRKLLSESKKLSFETVFSHASKIEFMKVCAEQGYKVYLYFVGTSSPDINKFRVKSRVIKGGHNVPESKIEDRYYRSMNLLWEAAQYCYQGYFFDNSTEGEESLLFAHFKVIEGKKEWVIPDKSKVPEWFLKYYVSKAN